MRQNSNNKKINLFSDDPFLSQYHEAIEGRYGYYQHRLTRLLGNRNNKLSTFANGH